MHNICIINLDFNEAALAAARSARASGIAQSQIAEALKVSQSQVSRVLSGTSKRHTRLLDEICIYVNSHMHEVMPPPALSSTELTDAIASVWDGTPVHARAIAKVIRSLGAFSMTARVVKNPNDLTEEAK